MFKALKNFFIFLLLLILIFLFVYLFDLSSYKTSSLSYKLPDRFLSLNFNSLNVEKINSLPKLNNDSEVLVKLKSCSIKENEKNTLYCNGFSGIVVDVGKDSKIFEIGAKVLGQLPFLYQNNVPEYISISEDLIILKPISLNFFQASLVANFIDKFYYGINALKEQIDKFNQLTILVDDVDVPEAEMIALFLTNFENVKLYTLENDPLLIKKLGIKNVISFDANLDIKFDIVYQFNQQKNISKYISKDTQLLTFNLTTLNSENLSKRLDYISSLAHDGNLPLFIDNVITIKEFNKKIKEKVDLRNNNIIFDINGKN